MNVLNVMKPKNIENINSIAIIPKLFLKKHFPQSKGQVALEFETKVWIKNWTKNF